ncbi:MAG: outer membrane beta-barrel protein [Bacteriovorax sp.]
MSMMKNGLLIIAYFLTAISASANVLIEPHLGYNLSGGQKNYNYSGFNVTTKYTGPQYGARVGYSFHGLMAGGAYTHSTFDLKATASGVTNTSKEKQDDLGIFIGYSAPVLLRAWATYYFSSKMTETEGPSKGDWNKGHTTELGIGFTPMPLVSLNLMYRMVSFDKQSVSGVETAMSPKYEPTELVLGMSIPFNVL